MTFDRGAGLQEDNNFGRILAAYGDIFVAGSLARGIAMDGFKPDRDDYLGATICLIGVAVILLAPPEQPAETAPQLHMEVRKGPGRGSVDWLTTGGSPHHLSAPQIRCHRALRQTRRSMVSPRRRLQGGSDVHRGLVSICAVALGGAALWLGPTPVAAAPETQQVTFGYTGAAQEFVVPEGVTRVSVEACGARGGNTLTVLLASGRGGTGGRARSDVVVTPGEALRVRVGGAGTTSAGGWNGGGRTGVIGGGGGGASDVRRGGDELANRVVIGGGGGGAGHAVSPSGQGSGLAGGAGGGAAGADGEGPPSVAGLGATQSAPGPGGSLGIGANGAGGGGGGGLQGGGSGASMVVSGFNFSATGGGGSGLGDELAAGACTSGSYVSISWEAVPSILPGGVLVAEGDGGGDVALLPVSLSAPADEPVTIDWTTGSLPNQPGYAQAGQDFVAASGTVTFQPGETVAYVPVEFTDDDADEPNLLWGEWGVVLFSDPTGATLDTSGFFGAGLFIIVDDD